MAAKTHVPRPDHAFIGNHTYQIDWLSTDEWQQRDFDMSKDGLTYAATSKMYIRLIADRPEAMYQEILLHEVTHAVWDSCGLGLLEDWNAGSGHEAEERVILLQTPALLFVFRQNPHIAKYLLSVR